jgi:hypothetical protein
MVLVFLQTIDVWNRIYRFQFFTKYRDKRHSHHYSPDVAVRWWLQSEIGSDPVILSPQSVRVRNHRVRVRESITEPRPQNNRLQSESASEARPSAYGNIYNFSYAFS